METWDAIRARRNVRRYTDRPLGEAELERILEAGRRTPSSKNEQPWDFVLVTEPERLRGLAEVWVYAGHLAGAAAAIALVAPRAGDGEVDPAVQYDLGQVTMSMALAATDLGIGSGHSAVGDQGLARRLLGLPEDRVCAWLLGLGYPADRELTPIEHPDRRPFDEVVHRETW